MTLAPGSRLGGYEIVAPIGAGGMGEVFKAKDTRLDRLVAIKVLPEDLFGDVERVGRFEREAKALAALNHPGIASVHAFEEIGGRHLLVQELLEGETLREAMSSGKLPLRKTLDHAVQIAKALAAAHEKGVVHRDLKPENLFITSDGRAKILDFGLAKLTKAEETGLATNLPTMSRGTEPGVVLGTLGYMSPEQVRGKPADARSDIFSFGAVLYEMLSGKKAFHGDSAADTMSAILKEDPPDLVVTNQSIPPGLERIVRHCLEKSPEQRFHSAHDLAFDLEALSGLSAPRLTASAEPGRARRVPMGTVTAAAAAALALGLLGGRLIWKTPPPEPPRYHRLTFRRGPIWSARFAPDGHTVVYGAQWDGTAAPQLYSTRVESPESSRLDLPTADVRSISRTGDMLLLDLKSFTTGYARTGTLSQAPISGSAARELLEDVGDADWAPDGASFAVVRAPGWHYRLEFPAGKVLLETSSWISEPHVSPKGDAIAFFDHPLFGDDRGAVALLDLKTGAKKTLAAGFDSLQGMAWSTAGDLLYFAGASRGNARALRTVTPSGEQRVLATTPTGLALQDVSKDGRVLFIQRNARLGVVGLLPGQTRERELSVLDWPYHPLLSRDGATMVVTEQGDGGGDGYSVYLRRLDVASSPVRLGEGEAMALSPDGAWVLARLIRSTPSQMQLLPTRAGQARPFPKDSLEHEVGWFFPDGKRILFVGHEPGRPLRTFVQDLDGGPARAVTPEGVEAELLGADGASLVIRAGDKRLASMPVAGGPATPIAGTEPGDEPLAWAGDGRSLFVAPKRRQPPAQVYRVDGATARRELWKEFTPSDTAGLRSFVPAAASADGKTLLFHYSGSLSELYVAEGIAPKGSSR